MLAGLAFIILGSKLNISIVLIVGILLFFIGAYKNAVHLLDWYLNDIGRD